MNNGRNVSLSVHICGVYFCPWDTFLKRAISCGQGGSFGAVSVGWMGLIDWGESWKLTWWGLSLMQSIPLLTHCLSAHTPCAVGRLRFNRRAHVGIIRMRHRLRERTYHAVTHSRDWFSLSKIPLCFPGEDSSPLSWATRQTFSLSSRVLLHGHRRQ
jgi:hypothetical protein